MPIMIPKGVQYIFESAGAPSAGTDEVQTITFGGTPATLTFTLTFQGQTTATIAWSATNNTLRDNIDAALEALGNIGTAGVTTAVGTMTAGVGTITVTFNGVVGKLAVDTMTAAIVVAGTGSPTVSVAETTPGVTATGRGYKKGTVLSDSTNGKLYINSGTTTAPTWTVVGSQS
jgi:hypothetical protein